MVIETDYEGSSVHTKPDIVFTSTEAARNANHDLNNDAAVPVYTDPPKKCF